jgi:uncharacterized protein (DUF2336 family)
VSAPVERVHELVDLVNSRALSDRERLLLAIVDLCAAGDVDTRPELRAVLGELFQALASQAEREIRRILAEKLADADWAPKALIDVLALDEIEIARPIIAASPLLEDTDLLRIVVQATVEHQIEVARRPEIGSSVIEALLDTAEPAVLTALAGNGAAHLAERDLQRLVDESRRIAALRPPLVRHPQLTRLLAEQLYAWVGEALRTAIAARFRVDASAFDLALAQAVREAPRSPGDAAFQPAGDERREAEARLVAKLQMAGQLRPGYLVRVLKERKLGLFEAALATLGEFDIDDVRMATAGRHDALALACVAAGLDRAVVPTVLEMVSELTGLPGALPPAKAMRLAAAFSQDRRIAAQAFRALLAEPQAADAAQG